MQWVLVGITGGAGAADPGSTTTYKSLGLAFDASASVVDYLLEGAGIPRFRFGDQLLLRLGVEKPDGVRSPGAASPESVMFPMMFGIGGQAAFAVTDAIDVMLAVSWRDFENHSRNASASLSSVVVEGTLRVAEVTVAASGGPNVMSASVRLGGGPARKSNGFIGARLERLTDYPIVGSDADRGLWRLLIGLGASY